MAFENLILRRRDRPGKFANVRIDGVIQESLRRSVEMTQNPIETGLVVSDHAVIQPVEYTLEGIITNTPLWITDYFGDYTGGGGGVVDETSNIYGLSEKSGKSRARQIYELLVVMMNNHDLIDVQTSLGIYKNLIFTEITTDTTAQTYNSVHFNATLMQPIFIHTSIGRLPGDIIEGDENQAAWGTPLNKGQVPVLPPDTDAIVGAS